MPRLQPYEKPGFEHLLATRDGDLAGLQRLVNGGADINKQDTTWGKCCLKIACRGNLGARHLAIVQWLLEQGADMEVTDNDHRTALHEAARAGRQELAQCLVEHGANTKVKDRFGWTPLEFARQEDDPDQDLQDTIKYLESVEHPLKAAAAKAERMAALHRQQALDEEAMALQKSLDADIHRVTHAARLAEISRVSIKTQARYGYMFYFKVKDTWYDLELDFRREPGQVKEKDKTVLCPPLADRESVFHFTYTGYSGDKPPITITVVDNGEDDFRVNGVNLFADEVNADKT